MIDLSSYHEGGEHPLIDIECSAIGKDDVICDCRHDELWHFDVGKANSDGAVDRILQTRNNHYSLVRHFLGELSILDSQTHRLRPTPLAADTLDYTPGRGILTAWKSEPTARILPVSGTGSETIAFASRVLGDLLEHHGERENTVLSFVFSKSDPQARTPLSLYLSLCRQLVSLKPQLFGYISSTAGFLTRNRCLTTECLWILLHSMVINLKEQGTPVYCIICSINECVKSPEETIQQIKKLVEAGGGRLKLLYTRAHEKGGVLENQIKQDGSITLDSTSRDMEAWEERHIQSRIQDLCQENPSWDGLTELALTQVRARPSGSTYMLIKVNMILLGWTTKGCTQKQLKEKLQRSPDSLEDCYDEAIRTIKDDCRTWALITLQWITCAIRPMTPAELAVAVALSEISGQAQQGGSDQGEYMSEIRDMIRRNIIGDLQDCMAPLVKVENNRVSFVDANFGNFLLANNLSFPCSESWKLEHNKNYEGNENDWDCHILDQCLEYLKHVGQLASASINHSDSQYILPTDYEYCLLTYALLHWPGHFLKTKSHNAARGHVLEFLKDEKRVSTWSTLYHQLNPSRFMSTISVNSPAQIVCRFGLSCLVDESITLAEGLAKSEEDLEGEKSKCLDLASEHGHHDVVQTLLGLGIRSKIALSLAAARGFANIVESILAVDQEGIEKPNWNHYAPIHHATRAGHKQVVSLLLDKYHNPDIRTTEAERDIESRRHFPPLGRNTKRHTRSRFRLHRRLLRSWEASESDSDSDTDADSNLHNSDQTTTTDTIPASVCSETSLQLAARTGQPEMMKLLLEKGAVPVAVSSIGYDVLKYAAVGGFVDVVALLLNYAVTDKPSAMDGNTALHLAAAHGHVKVVELLMKGATGEGYPVHMTNKKGLTPIHLAAREGHLDVLNAILTIMKRNKDSERTNLTSSNKEGKELLQDPSVTSPTETTVSTYRLDPKLGVRRRPTGEVPPTLAEQRVWISTNDDGHKSALEWAAEKGHCHVVQELLSRGVERFLHKAAEDSHGNTALHIAAKGGHSKTIEALLKNTRCAKLFPVGGLPPKRNMTPLHLAAKAGYADVLKTLLHYGAQLDLQDKAGWTALHHSARQGNLRCVDEILKGTLDAKMVNKRGETALHLAAQYGHCAVVRRVISQDPEILWLKDRNSAVALDLIVARGVLEEVKEFVQILEDAEGQDFQRLGMPLHAAAALCCEEVLKFLLSRGWNRGTRRGSDGKTALHVSVQSGFPKGVELLLNDTTNCDLNTADNHGNLPLHFARQLDIVHKLLDAKAKNDEKNHEGETPLYLAAWCGDRDILQALLNSDPKPDTGTTNIFQWTLLHAAYDNYYIVEMLLKHGVNLDAKNQQGYTPLSVALGGGYQETARVLLDAGADPNESHDFSSSPLCCAFSIDHDNLAGMVKSLVEKGADLLKGSETGRTALHLAVEKNNREVVDYIVHTLNSEGSEDRVSDLYSSVLCECVSASDFNPEMAKRLIVQGLDINKTTSSGLNPLQEACANGTVDAVKWLLNENADVNAKGSRYGAALCAAIESEKYVQDKVSLLLEHKPKAEINLSFENQPTPLQRAVSKGNASLVKLLLHHKADVNLTTPGYDTSLNQAIFQRDIPFDTISLMLGKGADIQKRGLMGKLPVHMAAINDRLDVMKLLKSKEANFQAKDSDGFSPLMYGLLSNSVSIVKFLLSLNAFNPDEADPKGQTPLIIATIRGDKGSLSELLSSGFERPHILNAQDFRGDTALIHAVRIDHIGIVEMLIKCGADPSVADCRGYSSLYWAVRVASQQITDVIIEAMEKMEGDTTEHWSKAIHGAVASSKRRALEQLLDRFDVDAEYPTLDGWTALFTTVMYDSFRMRRILYEKWPAIYREEPSYRKRPGCWHPKDKHPGIKIDPKNPTTLITDGTNLYQNLTPKIYSLERKQFGVARADFPMLPLFKDQVYYFEVTLNAVGNTGFLAIGFCDDQAPLTRMLGWDSGSWGFHSHDGKVFEDGRLTWKGVEYHMNYMEAGVTIGCGVNFRENTAFYTRNGVVIGRAFTDIHGKLYPAVSIDFCQPGWRVTAVFPWEDGTSNDFCFKGDFKGKDTLDPPESVQKGSEDATEDEEDEEYEEYDEDEKEGEEQE
ncbi:putative ankyrin repeat-containing domain protein [Rosellinia necatrix]|uniref:Putative ankyrin repeat-containing domain protein n=1 Tax=Rosellinia necatrix TaxID=77044 RepID=A0A1W2TGE2_ROSNE|nr:putative ankyrin repeat-containing domain protein [Rosellinia necatrix]